MAQPYQTIDMGQLYNGAVSSAAGAVYTNVSATAKQILQLLELHNTDASAVTITVWLVESGGSRTTANRMFNVAIPASGSWTTPAGWRKFLEPGSAIHLQASTNNVASVFIDGVTVDLTS